MGRTRQWVWPDDASAHSPPAESATSAGSAILSLDTSIHHRRGQPWSAWTRRLRADALPRRTDQGIAGLCHVTSGILAVCASSCTHCDSRFVPGSPEQGGGTRMRVKALLFLLPVLCASLSFAQYGGELHFCLHSYPKTFDPLLVDDDASETVRYLTGGVLVRVNRLTQQTQPELATEWKLSNGGKTVRFKLRDGIRYSDGSAFTSADVAYTVKKLMDPELHSSTADAFRSGQGNVLAKVVSPSVIELTFPAPVANLAALFDSVAIVSSTSPRKEMAALGPFYVAEHKAGSYLLLKKNPNYWKKDGQGHQLPYVNSIRLDIEQNPEVEALRFQRGEIDLINTVSPAIFE